VGAVDAHDDTPIFDRCPVPHVDLPVMTVVVQFRRGTPTLNAKIAGG
jgi:hypothetical protein